MRTPGTTVSAVGHLGLIGWLILGWGFDAEPLVFDDVSVSIVSGEEFEQMRAAATPEPGTAEPTAPVQPIIDETPPPPPAEEEPTETAPPPDPVDPPDEEVPPPAPPPAPPEPEVPDAVPVEPTPPVDPPSTPEVAVTDTPTPPDIDRVAPTPSEPTPPDTETAEVPQDAIVPDDTATAEAVVEEQDAAAPEEAAPEIAIEDEPPSGLVETSLRPTARPSRPAPEPEPEEDTQTAEVQTPVESVSEPEPEPPVENNGQSVDDVLAGLGLEDDTSEPATAAPSIAQGAAWNGAERDSFRLAVNRCWNVDRGSFASRVTVDVGIRFNPDGTVIVNSIELENADGDPNATQIAFEAARRAILRCGSSGYDLPADKYSEWQAVVIRFDPSGMR